ncbi:MAG: hypothetical protein WDN06_09900 [Asticcacaulis sp.]
MATPLKVYLATPRGFCAGVDRAIQIVEKALERYGAPVYVRHEIVHNRHVVDRLKALGRRLRQGTGPVPARPAGGLFGPWRAEVGAGRGPASPDVLPRRHLPARLQSPCRGRAPL